MSPLVLGAILIVMLVGGLVNYCLQQPVPNSLDLRSWDERVWLALLFLLPVLFQIFVLGFIFRSVRKNSDEVSKRFYEFVSRWTAVCSIAYCCLWILYPMVVGVRAGWMEALSYFALALALWALYPVFKMTYAIMRVEERVPSLKKSDVKDWQPFMTQLKGVSEEDASPGGRIVKLLKREHRELAERIGHSATVKPKRDRNSLGMAEVYEKDLIVALNRIARYPDFYKPDCFGTGVDNSDEKYRKEYKRLMPHEYQAFHLHLLRRSCPDAFRKFPLEPNIPEGRAGRLQRWWMKSFGELKDGAGAHPFWAVSFFFTLLLCITYLLAFAFAFHDKGAEKAKGYPALYKGIISPGEKEAKPFPTHAPGDASLFRMADLKNPAGLADKLRDGKDPLSRYIFTRLPPETQKDLGRRQNPHTLTKLSQKTLVEDLNRLLVDGPLFDAARFQEVNLTPETRNWADQSPDGEELVSLNRVLLEEAYPGEIAKGRNADARGRADWMSWPEYIFCFDSGTASFTRSEDGPGRDYENLKDGWRESPDKKRPLLPQKLEELKKMDVEWRQHQNYLNFNQLVRAIEKSVSESRKILVELKGSTDDHPPDQKTYSSNYSLSEARAHNIKYEVSGAFKEKSPPGVDWFITPASSEVPAKLISSADDDSFDAEWLKESKKTDETRVSDEDKNFLQRMLSRIKGGVIARDDKERLLRNEREVRARLEYVAAMAADERASYKDEVEHAKAALEGAVNLAESVDSQAGRRVVVVSVKLIEPYPPEAGEGAGQYVPLTLMDYMYFTMYTITTTGYGDIIPKTSYAKFLCSLANIIEVFFFVVFFNALLSVRRNKRSGREGGAPRAATAS